MVNRSRSTSASNQGSEHSLQKRVLLVLDSSVALAWCFHDERDVYADAIAAKLSTLHVGVPSLWHLEVANILLVGERRGRSLQADTVAWLAFLASLPLTVDSETVPQAWSATLSLARTHEISVYDAAYLELALRRGWPLATLDKKLASVAKEVGIPRFSP